ncbi:MAG TPA: S8 family serine peptidase [Verrucomicrobiae bacterium]|nr:S8 family serine peptidase [Verrucomicrobiae bacterium]
MMKRPILWLVAGLLCILGVWCAWHWLNPTTSRAGQTAATPAAPHPTTPPAKTAQANAQLVTSNLPPMVLTSAGYRLSNTLTPLNELIGRDTAILLENARLDSAAPLTLGIPAHLRAQGDPGSYIVQSRGAVNAAFREHLRAAGVTLVSYIPNNAWLVRGSEAQVAALAALPDVQATLPFEPYFKLKSSLLPLAVNQQRLPAGEYLNVVLFADAQTETERALSALGSTIVARGPSPFGPVVTIQPQPGSLVKLAQLPGVQIIERAAARVLANDLARVKLGVSTDTLTPDNYYGLTGTNVLVAMADSGVDITHPDLVGRVITNSTLAGEDTEGHGTHVAGIIAGSGAASGTIANVPPGSVAGANYRGKAPGAKLFSMLLGETPIADLGFDAYNQEQAALTNALISNNSWGKGADYDYDITAASYDAAVRDALPGISGSQPVLFVFPAGNDGGGDDNGLNGSASSIVSPGTAKNVITVGAIEQLRNITNEVVIDGQTNAIWSARTDTDTEVASYSSRGNVGIGVEGDFGRFKPDVVAPGTFVVSTRSSQWDTNAYYSITNYLRNTFADQQLAPNALNQYSLFVPVDGIGLQISAIADSSSTNPAVDLPIYVRTDDQPSTNDVPLGTNTVTIAPAPPLVSGSGYFYAVGNSTNVTVHFTIQTVITYTNHLADYYRVLQQLNDALGPNYRYESGTSMAAPAISGMLALMQELYQQRLGLTNSPALMKAMLINGARSSSSLYNLQVNNTINYQGWGLASLPNSLPQNTNATTTDSSFVFFDQSSTNALATGQSQTRLVTLNNSAQGKRLRFTLVWTDPPGNPAAGVKLVNDLDLVVTNLDTGAVYYGNNFAGESDFTSSWDTNSVPNRDVINNVENVYLSTPGGTNFAVTVVGRRVNVNAVTANTNDVVQDYALVMSSEAADAMTVVDQPIVTAGAPYVTTITNTSSASLPLLNQSVGANSPLIAAINGVTNQWHFYVATNYGTNVNFTNAAFITFLSPTLASPRMGVRATIADQISRPEADIDMYVSQDPSLTNLNAAAVAAATRSVGRGGTEIVTYSNSAPGQVYYIGIKSEDQMAGQYAFFSVFSDQPFSERDKDGNLIVRGVPAPAEIPDGTPEHPGVALVFGIAIEPIKVRRVIVTNTITHENMGDLLGNLSHNNGFTVLNNHTYGNGNFSQTFVYDDSDQGDTPGSQHTDGPGNLQNFVGQEGVGLWLLTELDDAPTAVGRVNNLIIKIEPQQLDTGDTFTIQPNGWGYDFIDVPAEATNLTVNLVNISANPLPMDLYIRRGDFPTFTAYDKKTTINPPGGSLSISRYDLPPLQAGRYYIGVYNPNGIAQTVRLTAKLDLDVSAVVPVVYTSTNPVPLLDDAVTYDQMVVTNDAEISSVEVGLRVNHPRVSDLAIQLISPKGKRVMLFENRGGTNADLGANVTNNFTNTVVFADFSTASGLLSLTGVAQFTNNFLRLTPALDGQTGDAWLINKQKCAQGFDTTFHFRIPGPYGNIFGNEPGGDGFTFSIQNIGPTATDWAMGGTNNNISVFFNTFWNWPGGGPDLSGNSIGVVSNQQYLAQADVNTLGINMSDGNIHEAHISFDGSALSIWLDGLVVLTNVPVAGLKPGTDLNGEGWVGFTAGTGAAYENHDIMDWTFTAYGAGPVIDYLTFTEDTNKTTTPIKFGLPPFRTQTTNMLAWASGFEGGVGNQIPTAGNYFGGGWLVDAGSVDVLMNGTYGLTSDSGTFCMDINGNSPGTVSTNVSTIPGANYILSFAYSRNPDGIASGVPRATALVNGTALTAVAPSFVNSWTNLNWQHAVAPFVAVGTNTTISLRADTPGTYGVMFDTLTLTNVTQFGGIYLPEEPLTELKGDSANGTWKLEVWDSRVGATNPAPELVSWYLSFVFPSTTALPVTVQPQVNVTNTVPPGGIQYLVVDVPPWATAATNSLVTADQPLLVWFNQTDAPTGTNPPDILFYGGAVTSGTQTLVTNGTPPLLPGERYFIGVQNTNTAPANYVFRVDYDITPLANAVPVSGTLPSSGLARYFSYDVSSNASAVSFDLFGMDGNLDLVASRAPQIPNVATHDYASFSPGTNDEQIVVFTNGTPVALSPGLWYLGVLNPTASTVNFTIEATELTNAFQGIITLTNAVPYYVVSNTAAAGTADYFRYSVSPTAARVQFETFGATGDFTLVARKGFPLPDLATYDYLSANPGTNDELIVVFTNSTPVALSAGDWFLSAVKNSAGPADYAIMATEWPQSGLPIVITSIDVSSGSFCVTWTSLPGAHYLLQGSPTLAPATWSNVSPEITALDNSTTWCVPITGQMQFFRVIEGTAP